MAMAFADVRHRWRPSATGRERTGTGDRAELEGLPEDLVVWSDILGGAETASARSAPEKRLLHRADAAARGRSDIVIVNHHLLCADASVRQNAYGEVIPECHVAIIDEAHQLEDVATQYLGTAVSTYRSTIGSRRRAVGGERALCGTTAAETRQASDRVARPRGVLLSGAARRGRRRRIGPYRVPARAGTPDRQRVTASLLGRRPAGRRGPQRGPRRAAGWRRPGQRPGEDLAAMGRRAGEMRDELSFLLRCGDPDYVYYLKPAAAACSSGVTHRRLDHRARGRCSTAWRPPCSPPQRSASPGRSTTSGGHLGVGDAEESGSLPSSGYEEQAILYLPPGMPDPRSPLFATDRRPRSSGDPQAHRGKGICPLHQLLGAGEVERRLSPALDYPVLVQGSAPRSVLFRQFRSLGNAVLLGHLELLARRRCGRGSPGTA